MIKNFSISKKKKSIRDGYGEALVEVGEQNEDVVVITADVAESVRVHWFKEKFPERFIEVGIAEQNMAGVAAGLALAGKIPFMAAYAIFSPGRNWEQIRTTIAYNNLPVKIIGSHAGLVTGEDGSSHQALEDIALMQVLPNFVVFSPADYNQAKQVLKASLKINGPVYLRGVREKTYQIIPDNLEFIPGKAQLIFSNISPNPRKGKIAIFVTGHLLYQAIQAALELKKEIEVSVFNFPTIKPLDAETVEKVSKEVDGIVVVEEHQKIGGLGASIAQVIGENNPKFLEFVAVEDKFGESGKADELLEAYSLTPEEIVKKSFQILGKISKKK